MPRNERETSRKRLRMSLDWIGIEDAKDIVELFSEDMDSSDLIRIEELVTTIWEQAKRNLLGPAQLEIESMRREIQSAYELGSGHPAAPKKGEPMDRNRSRWCVRHTRFAY
jgi:hypothetical protein